jgi:hypothetical protein
MRVRFAPACLVLASLVLSPPLQAQSEGLPYTRGSVWAISMVRTTAGFNDDYLRSLASTWRRANEEAKKQGLIQSYKILSANPSGPDDWNLLLMVELKNWAALDGLEEKLEAITQKVVGDQAAQRQLATKRLEIRRILATKNAQELFLR